jgi:2-aminoethylphosphonate-pyruvate transaminase
MTGDGANMAAAESLPGWKDKVLFTPGPLTTSQTVKQAMLRDLGSRDHEFIGIVRDIRRRLVELGQVTEQEYTAIPIQGSGTYGLEAVVSSAIPRRGKLMVVINGAYGRRIAKMASILGIETQALEFPENVKPDLKQIEALLQAEGDIAMLAVVHCETTTGIVNPIAEIGALAKRAGVDYFVDAMSSFGAIPLDLARCHIDYLVSSANKCIEGVPGFSFVLARLDCLKQTQGYARSLSLDLHGQWSGLEQNGQFRFTPPTHALLAFHQALLELEAEGGVQGRAARYEANYGTLVQGMRKLGFHEYLAPADQGYIITSFRYPDDPKFSFDRFYDLLNARGYVIYPGKVSDADCFRIGNIGRLTEPDVKDLLAVIADVCKTMDVTLKPAGAQG